jgi:long-subunit fatty acid transport protein
MNVRWSPAKWLDLDLGYAHFFLNDPGVDVIDPNTHSAHLVGSFDASVDIVSASVTVRWGGPHEEKTVPIPDGKSYRK